jgi:hypothetical protein
LTLVFAQIMAGLLDQSQLAGDAQALTMVTALADWVVQRVDKTLARGGQQLWQCVLGTEWGGMNGRWGRRSSTLDLHLHHHACSLSPCFSLSVHTV